MQPKPAFLKKNPRGEVTEVAYLRKAVKRHTCNEGKEIIPKGETYVEDHINRVHHYSNNRSFKRWQTYRICQSCWKAPILG